MVLFYSSSSARSDKNRTPLPLTRCSMCLVTRYCPRLSSTTTSSTVHSVAILLRAQRQFAFACAGQRGARFRVNTKYNGPEKIINTIHGIPMSSSGARVGLQLSDARVVYLHFGDDGRPFHDRKIMINNCIL